jgi:hypothetical protein
MIAPIQAYHVKGQNQSPGFRVENVNFLERLVFPILLLNKRKTPVYSPKGRDRELCQAERLQAPPRTGTNEQPQGKPCGIDKTFRCLIGVTYSSLPKYTDYSPCQDTVKFSFKLSLFTVAASRGVLNRKASSNEGKIVV